jgi:hypothetical protein
MATQIFHIDLFEMLPNLFICNTRCNYGAEMMALNVGRFAGLGVGMSRNTSTLGNVGASRNATQVMEQV